MIEGGCQCGKVRFRYHGEIDEISLCHCKQCQKAQGSAFVAACPVDTDRIEVEGAESIREYPSSPGKVRAFCQHCGSPLYSAHRDKPGVWRLRIGTLDHAVRPDRRYHKYVEDRAAWYDIADGLDQHVGNFPK